MNQVAQLPRDLDGLTVLIVEDETIVSFLIEDMLAELGCGTVLHAASVTEGLNVLERELPDVAVLDVNLGGENVFPLAEKLLAARVPFVFATGYGSAGMPDPWARRVVLQKPFQIEALGVSLRSVLADSSSAGSPGDG